MTENKTRHCRGVRERQRWQGKIRQRLVGRNRNHEWVARIARRLLERGAVDLDLWMGMEFEALDQQEVYGSHLSYQLIEGRFCVAAQFVLQSPAAPRGDHDFACSGLTVAPRILAWLIEIESVVCMLDG